MPSRTSHTTAEPTTNPLSRCDTTESDRCPTCDSSCICNKAAQRAKTKEYSYPRTQSGNIRTSDRDENGKEIQRGPGWEAELPWGKAQRLMELQEPKGEMVGKADGEGGEAEKRQQGGREVGHDIEGKGRGKEAMRLESEEVQSPSGDDCATGGESQDKRTLRKDSLKERCGKLVRKLSDYRRGGE